MSARAANPGPGRGRLTELLDGEFMAALDALDILSRKVFQGKLQGERRARRRGQSVEFADHRPYAVGDDLRFVDWNIYIRLDQLFIKLFLEEQDLSVHLLIDHSASTETGEPTKLLAARRLAAALGYVALVNNCRLTVSTFAEGITGQLANIRGRRSVYRLAEFLLACPTGGATAFDDACRQAVAGPGGRGVTIVLSDFLFKGGYEQGLRRLISRNVDLYVLQVLSPDEIEPDLSGDLKLRDIEDGDEAEITVTAALLEVYKRNLAGWCEEIKAFCRRRGATYSLIRSDQDTQDLMLRHLRLRGLLR